MRWINSVKQLSVDIWLVLLLITCSTSEAQSQTVYITRTGAKYHEGSCRYLRQSKIAIDLEEAQQRGYTPCSVCDPGTAVEEEELETEIAPREPQGQQAPKAKQKTTTVNENTTGNSTQCSAYTKAGSRCKRAASSNGRCWQHQ